MIKINIKTLKKEAKLLRKNNNSIKNHAESLDLIAQKYEFKNWNHLIDQCSLVFEEKNITIDFMLKNFTGSVIANQLIGKLNLDKNNDQWYIRTKNFINIIMPVLTQMRDKNKIILNKNQIQNLLTLDYLEEIVKQDSIETNQLQEFLNGLPYYPERNYRLKQEELLSYITMMMIDKIKNYNK